MDKLKPCPFCGAVPIIQIGLNMFNDAEITCECGVSGGMYDEAQNDGFLGRDAKTAAANKKQAIAAWNTRHDPA